MTRKALYLCLVSVGIGTSGLFLALRLFVHPVTKAGGISKRIVANSLSLVDSDGKEHISMFATKHGSDLIMREGEYSKGNQITLHIDEAGSGVRMEGKGHSMTLDIGKSGCGVSIQGRTTNQVVIIVGDEGVVRIIANGYDRNHKKQTTKMLFDSLK